MRISDDRYRRDMRRYHLARRLFAHGARRCTIMRWTGLSRHSVETLMNEYALTDQRRPRGPTPASLSIFASSLVHEVECAAMAYVGFQLDIIPQGQPGWRRREPTDLALAEQLVTAYELYRSLVKDSVYRVEHMALLVHALATPGAMTRSSCELCTGLILTPDGFSPTRICAFCRSQFNGHARLFVPFVSARSLTGPLQSSPDNQRSNT